jgi:PDZ domain-containing protein
MHSLRASWWLYVAAAVFTLTFLFNARQEAFGPANAGWIAAWPSLRVANVKPGSPMEKAGLRPGDLLEAADGLPLTGMPDWFVARAHFERGRPVEVQVKRGEQRLRLQFVITAANSSAWQRAHAGSVVAFYLARFMLLFLAIFVRFQQTRASQRSPCRPDVCHRCSGRRVSQFRMGCRAWPSACSTCAFHFSCFRLLPALADDLAAVLRGNFPVPPFAIMAAVVGTHFPGFFRNGIDRFGHCNDLQTIGFASTLAAGAFGCASALYRRGQRRVTTSVSECLAVLAMAACNAAGIMACYQHSVLHAGLSDAGGRISPR